jgi:hypothetical protein
MSGFKNKSMRSISYCLIIFSLALTCSCKKEKKEQPGNMTDPSLKKLKNYRSTITRSVDPEIISNSTYVYNSGGQPVSINTVDSVFESGSWRVTNSGLSFQYNSSNRPTNRITAFNGTVTRTARYLYDGNGLLRFVIETYGSETDTTEYVHDGNRTIAQPKYPGDYYGREFYKNGDADSSVHYIGATPTERTLYSYSFLKKDLSFSYLNQYNAFVTEGKELGSTKAYAFGGLVNGVSYSYVYDSEGYPVKCTVTRTGLQNHTSEVFYSYY